MSLRRQLARKELACGLSSERANKHSQRLVATNARRASLCTAPWSIALSRSNHNAATPSGMNRFVPLVCDGPPGGHHVIASTRRSRGSVKPVSREADEAKRSGLTEPWIAGQSRVVMAAVHALAASRRCRKTIEAR